MRRPLALSLTLLAAASGASAQTVDAVANRHQCSTAGVVGLSQQLVDTQLCLFPGVFVNAAPHAGIALSESRIFSLAQVSARNALWAAAGTITLQVNSMFRTLADQYVLYHSGACGLAATPGNSNHETGIAVDLANWSAAQSAMTRAGCRHTYPGTDDVHFDCPGTDRRADSIHAFQHLWNINNASDRIDEDGAYGPITAARVARSPAGGFAQGGCPPAAPAYAATLVTVSCPTDAVAGDRPTAYVDYRNTGTATWDTTNTRLGTTGPRDHRGVFYDSINWLNTTRPSAVDHATAPGATGRFSFVLAIPDVDADMTVSETYGLVQESVTWFGPADDAVRCSVRVHARVRDAGVMMVDAGNADVTNVDVASTDVGRDATSDGAAADASDAADVATDVGEVGVDVLADAGEIEGGDVDPVGGFQGGCQCHTGVGAKPAGGSLALLAGALVVAWRRRRRR